MNMMKLNVTHQLCSNWTAAIVVLVLFIPTTCSQTVYISASTPSEGARFKLDCVIVSNDISGNNGFLWIKDGENIAWSQNGVVTNLDTTGSYEFQEYREIGDNKNYHFEAIIAQYSTGNDGEYTCILAEGTYENFVILAESSVFLGSNDNIQSPDTIITTAVPKRTLTSSELPICFPDNDLHALIYTNVTIKCTIEISADNSITHMGIYAFMLVENTVRSTESGYYEVIHTFTAIPREQNTAYECQVQLTSLSTSLAMTKVCKYGSLQIELFQEHLAYVTEGDTAVFNCTAGLYNKIGWSSDPPIKSRLTTVEPNLLQIANVQPSDDGIQVTCTVLNQPAGKELHDTATLIVIPLEHLTVYTTNIIEEITEQNTTVSTSIATAEPPNLLFNKTTLYILAAVGGAFVVLILVAICVAVCLRCRKSDKEDNLSEDNKPTRISTGYVWDRELSQKVHESPMPSPRLSERNPYHASAVKGLQNKEKANGVSPSLAYALTHLSDDDFDSDTDTLKPGRDCDASVPSNTYVKVAHDAPSGPAPPPPTHNNDIPTYATPDKGRIKDSLPLYASADEVRKTNDRVSIPTLDPQYAIVRPDPENPIVRALSEKQNGAVNAAYRSDEETGET